MSKNNEDINNILKETNFLANDNQHEHVTLEHLLYVLLKHEEIKQLVLDVGGQPTKIIFEIQALLSVYPKFRRGQISSTTTQAFTRVWQRAISIHQINESQTLTKEAVLLSLMREVESDAAYILQKYGVTQESIKTYMDGKEKEASDKPSALAEFCTNLNVMAEDGHIDPVIGRESIIEELLHVMARRRKNNAILTGLEGTGKTSIAEGLAQKIVEGSVPPSLRDKVVYSLDIGSLTAGTKYRGDFEDRVKKILDDIEKQPNVVLFIDEIHMILGAGAASGNESMDLSNLLKPMLAKGKLICIGATTDAEFTKKFEKDRALLRRFNRINVNEPDVATTKKILAGLERHYTKFHGITYAPGTLDVMVDLAARYITGKQFPDKAIDVLDATGAYAKLTETPVVTNEIVIDQVSKICRVPVTMIDTKKNEGLDTLESRIKDRVYGQDTSIETIVDAIIVAKSGLRDRNKPIANLLAVGSTGSGKTHLCKELASALGSKLVRFDMSEYMEEHSVSKLIGTSPGYTGYDDGDGLMIAQIEKNPNCVLLLDEIEKAHPKVLNILLQVLDDGILTSSKGKTVYFNNAVIIMTSNLGAADSTRNVIGFSGGKATGEVDVAINKFLSPEFRNRLDGILKFNQLGEVEMNLIVNKAVSDLNKTIADKNITVELKPSALAQLAKDGFNPEMGARPLARLFEKEIKKPISREILFGNLQNGGKVIVDYVKGAYTFKTKALIKAKEVV